MDGAEFGELFGFVAIIISIVADRFEEKFWQNEYARGDL